MVAQTKSFVADDGFKSLKLKGGILKPDLEIETILKLCEVFSHHGLRIDPIGAWPVPTAARAEKARQGVLEYLEYPVRGISAVAELLAQLDILLASNLVGVAFEQIIEAVKKDAVQIVLAVHHYGRGATGAIHLGEIC